MDMTIGEAAFTTISLSPSPPSPAERREGKRHMAVLQTGKIIAEGREELCLIRNISSGGMKAAVYGPIFEGEKVEVHFKLGASVAGMVVWVRGGRAGIQFDERIDVHHVLMPRARDGEGRMPRAPRLNVAGLALVQIDGADHGVQVCDISPGGIKIELTDCGEIDDDVIVNMPGLPVSAGVIRWKDATHMGISFNRTLPLDQIAYWAAGQTLREPRRQAA